MKRILLYIIFFTAALGAQSQSLVRGPYLQSPGPHSIIIHWRTDSAANSRVTYGLSLGANTFITDSSSNTTEHRVQLSGLLPHTKYYYTIGSASQSLRGPDSLLHFTTAPDPSAATPVRLWATGCFGQGNAGQRLVRSSYDNYTSTNRPADLWLWLGDNAYDDGNDSEYQAKVFDHINGYYQVLPNLPFASTPGNRDYNTICPWQPNFCTQDPNLHAGPYLDIIDPPFHGELGGVASNLKIFYSFDYGDIHFISLNTELGSANANYDWLGVSHLDTAFTSPMTEWLKADLAASTKKWKIAFWHQPPYSVHPVTTEISPMAVAAREHFNPILEQYGVDMVLCAHDHSYQRSYLINGHYGDRASFTPNMLMDGSSGDATFTGPYVKYTDGPLAGKGTVYVIQGNSGSNSSYVPVGDPAMFTAQLCDTCMGSFLIDIDGDRLDAHFMSAYGATLDQFTILKQSATAINKVQNDLYRADVYPNPLTVGSWQLKVSTNLIGGTAEITDAYGRVVFRSLLETQNSTLDVNLARGVYFLRIMLNGEQVVKQVVRQ